MKRYSRRMFAAAAATLLTLVVRGAYAGSGTLCMGTGSTLSQLPGFANVIKLPD
jgi:hypothetical protein